MKKCIGVRKETKDKTQRRAPLSPDHVRELAGKHGVSVIVEPWPDRIFPDEEYRAAGAVLSTDLSPSNIVFGVKEIAPRHLLPDQAYCMFSHTIKGQSYNMPMLARILETGGTLFDYELVEDDRGKRLVFFGDYAGYAGMIDTMWALGKRLDYEGIPNPFSEVKYATQYQSLDDAQRAFRDIGTKIRRDGLPARLVPLIVGFTGYGHVSKAAQRIFDLFPVQELRVSELHEIANIEGWSSRLLYKIQFRKPEMYRPKRSGTAFDVKLLRAHPEQFISGLERYVPYLTVIVNGIYWEPRYPRILTIEYLKDLFSQGTNPRLRVIGDITCDIGGSIEPTVKATNADNPVFVYDPATDAVINGWEGSGPVILAVDKLPAELPREASEAFGRALLPFVPALAAADYYQPTEALRIPPEFRNALIVHRGTLTAAFSYLRQFLR